MSIHRYRSWFAMAAVVGVSTAWLATPSFSALLGPGDSAAIASAAADEPTECFADGWTAESAEEAAQLIAGAKPCRPCRDRTWCTCSYNGGQRVSCDPCCYQNYAGDIICLD